MKTLFRDLLSSIPVFLLSLCLAGCTASEETEYEYEDEVETQPPPPNVVVKKDTAEVKVVTPAITEPEKSPKPAVPPPVVSTPVMVYAVQIGAFEIPENADGVEQVAKWRFTLPVRKYYDGETNLYKVTVGSFASKDEALEWRKILNEKYPGEYRDAWIVEIPK